MKNYDYQIIVKESVSYFMHLPSERKVLSGNYFVIYAFRLAPTFHLFIYVFIYLIEVSIYYTLKVSGLFVETSCVS